MSRLLGGRELFIGEILDTIPQRVAPGLVLGPMRQGWPSYRLLEQHIFGLKCLVADARGPYEDRECVQQIFELTLDADYPLAELESRYLTKIEPVIGRPIKANRYATQSAAQVAYSADWDSADLRVTLSIYGGPRASHGGMATAGLFVNLRDELPIMARYAAALSARESALWGTLTSPDVLHISRLQTKLTPFSLQPWAVQSDPVRRKAQKAFYKRDLLETPPLVSQRLAANEVMLWRHSAHLFVSTQFDTVQLVTGQTTLEVVNILPARGGGGLSVHVGELQITDVPGSRPLTELVEAIQAVCAVRYRYQETYDD
ncbi:MAG: hypothetical protein IPK17_36290 [Chloroflexi bacterium]|uniref:hypothetical protein n=1 Tax=Candidatus Flexifilum breve TaxID=3140694 RepID=UPI003136035A|nr:hypothetical protein [Chloroflexota bacterium]